MQDNMKLKMIKNIVEGYNYYTLNIINNTLIYKKITLTIYK
jgi:hypothetical protein